MTLEFEGIGTHWRIEIFNKLASSNNIFSELKTIVEDFENNYSRFKEISLLSQLNKNKSFNNPSEEFSKLLKIGEDAKRITHGHFDIAVGNVLEKMGYDSNYSFKSTKLNNIETQIHITPSEIKIGENTRIDLGGIGKGFEIDKIKDFLINKNIEYFFINAGGDIYATSINENPIEFFLENPFDNTQAIGKVLIMNESIAASSPSRRKWKDQNNKEFNHLVDMVSKNNVKDIAGVFTLGKSALETDIASTAFFVSNSKLYEDIAKFYNVEFMIVYSDGTFARSPNYKVELFS